MADFGVLKAMRALLADNASVQENGFSEHIHLAIPPAAQFPMILLELEEVWTSMKLGSDTANTRLKLKASIVSQNPTGKESLSIADKIKQVMDGKTLSLLDGKQGIFKLANSIIDLPCAKKPRKVEQYYEVLIRG
ncbi:MAG: hypothetical protein K2W94_06100 [Alphaproteobacteria bacterium]|nr:hypothetical protein [Alphaproteobacteria bacterium]